MKALLVIASLVFLVGCNEGGSGSEKVAAVGSSGTYVFYSYESNWDANHRIAAKWTINTDTKRSEYIEFLISKNTEQAVSFQRNCETNISIAGTILTISDISGFSHYDLSRDNPFGTYGLGYLTNATQSITKMLTASDSMKTAIEALSAPGYTPCP